MSPQDIAASLDVHFGELGRPRRSRPEHHRSVRTVVGWSYNLLDPLERTAFRVLAVFVGSFDGEAACAVGPMSLDMLVRLIDKSLVTVVPGDRVRTRYTLLDTVRDYARRSWSQPARSRRRAPGTGSISRPSASLPKRAGCRPAW